MTPASPMAYPDAHAGHAVRLREGPHPQHARVRHVERGDGRGRRRVGIRFVDDQEGAVGNAVDQALHVGRTPPRSHGAVGIGEVDQRRLLLSGRGQQGLGVLAVARVRHAHPPPAEAVDVIVERGIRAGRGDDRLARLHGHAHREPEQGVDAAVDGDVARRDAVMARDGRLELVHLGVAVHPRLRGGRAHRLDGPRRRPEHALVRADARAERPPAHPLLGLGPDEGHGRGKAGDQGSEARAGHGGPNVGNGHLLRSKSRLAAAAVAAASVPRSGAFALPLLFYRNVTRGRLEAGMDAYVSKPLEIAALFAAIDRFVPARVELSAT